MNHPRLTELRDLKPGDRVSRYSRPGEVQTAPVARLTATQIVVIWPDETEARYWRESGTRTNCRGEVLRMPADEPEAAGPLLHCGGCDVDHESDSAFALGHPCPMCGWELLLAQTSAPVLPVELLTLSTPCPVFYAALGPFLANGLECRRDGVVITHQPGKTWVVALVDGLPVGCGAVFLPEGDQAELASAYVLPEFRHQGVYRRLLLARTEIANAAGKTRILATCTPASAAILARLGFVAIGESAGYTTMSLSAK